jgi:ABC-2 type transport system permease protein
MTGFTAALYVETLKIRRSRVLWLATLAYLLLPCVGALFMVILKDPAHARQLGLISTKAQLTAGTADWPTYFSILIQGTAIGGIMIFSVAVSWLFGREFADHTIKDLLALPTSRAAIVTAKLFLFAVWVLILVAAGYGLCLGLGAAIGLPGWSQGLVAARAGNLAVTALLTAALITPVALTASAGRGYLPPMGFAIFTVFLAQIVAVTGWGGYFPWAVPALYSGMAGRAGSELGAVSYAIVAFTSAVGLVGTFAWWQYADHTA